MGFVSKAACFIGFHDWGQWKYKSEDTECLQIRFCSRLECRASEQRTEHDWQAWKYVSKNSCKQKRICKRNRQHFEEAILNHHWTEWDFEKLDSCRQDRKCTRCGLLETKIEHTWGVWEYEAPKSCKKVRICHRCHERQEDKVYEIVHDKWTEWKYSKPGSCAEVERHCIRCGKWDYKFNIVEVHDWAPHPQSLALKLCRNCGRTS